jgi:hypothetical protein
MELQAWQAGLVSGAAFALVALLSALAVRRMAAVRREWVGLSLVACLVAFALLVPPPLVLLGRIGVVTFLNDGHAGYNFLAPYLAICVASVIAAAAIVRRGAGTDHAL